MPQQPEPISSSLGPEPGPAPVAGPDLLTPALPPSPPSGPQPVPPPERHAAGVPPRIPRWLIRAELFLRVLLRLYLGLFLCYAPWWRLIWDRNPLFVAFPTLAIYAANGAVRGVISGLGLLNLWIAFQDAVSHRNE